MAALMSARKDSISALALFLLALGLVLPFDDLRRRGPASGVV
jgi:hypothetical protein